ncbi:MAG: ergothioneine biosynthesis glutamate--cysteine ligase EgtA [Acidimicrobiales bacterium]
MPSPHRCLQAADIERIVGESCFAPAENGLVGVEHEWLLVRTGEPGAPVDHPSLRHNVLAAGPLPGGSTITFEPGGQLELSSPPRRGPQAACAVMADDLAVVRSAVARHGVEMVGLGLDPLRYCRRVVDGPRYGAMEAYFDAGGSAGRAMMCETAAVQVNLDIGTERSQRRRWHLAHRLGPVLLAAFANSPLAHGAPNGWRSGRAAVWAGIDPTRTDAASAGRGAEPVADWARYALAAQVMLIKVSEQRFEPIAGKLPFARWIDDGHELGFPTVADLEYHFSTLFPPVRPRGWLELRMFDSLPDPWWQVAVAVSAALFDDEEAAERAARATAATAGLWREAARHGLGHPALAVAAHSCFQTAIEALPRLGANAATVATTAGFFDRFVARGRCPADDVLDGWRHHGGLFPLPRPLAASWT